jgi:DNA-binding transcriptional ArsR family regulator
MADLIYNRMVVDDVDQQRVDRMFRALADATRRDIVVRVLRGESSVSALARGYPISLTAIQKHVDALARAGLVTKHRSGREQIVRADIDTIRRASLVLDRFEEIWRDRMDRFASALDGTEPTAPRRGDPT